MVARVAARARVAVVVALEEKAREERVAAERAEALMVGATAEGAAEMAGRVGGARMVAEAWGVAELAVAGLVVVRARRPPERSDCLWRRAH